MPPHSYLDRILIDHAKRLLCNPAYNCTEVASMVGFTSLHHFSKVFKKIEGLSPAHWARTCLPSPPKHREIVKE